MTSKRTVRWTASNGKEITVEISVTREHTTRDTLWADGDSVVVERDEIKAVQSIVAMMDGTTIDEAYLGQLRYNIAPNSLGAVAAINKVVGLKAETLALVEATIAEATEEAESDPEIMACRARIADREAAADKATAEYERREKAVDNMMTLGGHTY